MGIVKMVHPNKERQGLKVTLYNYRNNYGVLPNAKKVQQFGFTLDTIRAPGLTSDSTISQDTIGHADRGGLTASSGGTRILSASFYGNSGIANGIGRGLHISVHNNSEILSRESTFSYMGASDLCRISFKGFRNRLLVLSITPWSDGIRRGTCWMWC